jgi:hypothetical protein
MYLEFIAPFVGGLNGRIIPERADVLHDFGAEFEVVGKIQPTDELSCFLALLCQLRAGRRIHRSKLLNRLFD